VTYARKQKWLFSKHSVKRRKSTSDGRPEERR